MWLAGGASSRCRGTIVRRPARCGAAVFELWDVCGVTPPPQAYEVLGTSLRIVGELDDAAQLLQRGIGCLEPGSPSAAALYYAASVVAAIRADRDTEGSLLDAARRHVRPDDVTTLAAIEVGSAWWHLSSGRPETCAHRPERGLELARG